MPFDCSGLVMEAYASAGISIARTSQEQWASEPQVSTPQPGDLVFFPVRTAPGQSPGHVGIVTDPRRTMIDAYATGYPIGYAHVRPGRVPARARRDPVGFTDPAAHAGVS